MTDVARETYRRLMAEIAELEDRLTDLEQNRAAVSDSPNPQDLQVVHQELHDLRETLAAKRNELARLSDGCGKPHAQS